MKVSLATHKLADRLASVLNCVETPAPTEGLKAILAQFATVPDSISRDQLIQIAREKNGGKLSISKSLRHLEANGEATVKQLTQWSFQCDDSETQMRLLLGLGGVGVPVASCILAWTQPDKYGVIDRRACESIASLTSTQLSSQSVLDWVTYLSILRATARLLEITPMDVDRRLYQHNKHR